MKLPKEVMRDKLDEGVIHDTIVDNSRWSIQHEIIFEHEGKNYRAYYSVGATEQQDESPWEFDTEVEVVEVHEVEKMVKVWEEVSPVVEKVA